MCLYTEKKPSIFWRIPTLEVCGPIDLEAECHYLGAQGAAPKQGLHAVCDVHLSVKHVPQQRRKQVFGVKQGDKDTGQFVHLVGSDHVGQRHGNGEFA